jgi:hypothetical protein
VSVCDWLVHMCIFYLRNFYIFAYYIPKVYWLQLLEKQRPLILKTCRSYQEEGNLKIRAHLTQCRKSDIRSFVDKFCYIFCQRQTVLHVHPQKAGTFLFWSDGDVKA